MATQNSTNTSITSNSTSTILYGGTTSGATFTINGTSSGNTTGSFVVLQPTGGNVGIGTTGLTYNLEVAAGNANVRIISSTDYAGLRLRGGSVSDAEWLLAGGYPAVGDFTIREAGVSNYFTIKKTTGNIGIGTTAPKSKLMLSGAGGDPAASGDLNTGFIIGAYGGIGLSMGTTTSSGHSWIQSSYTDNAAVVRYLLLNPVGGNVGIGTNAPLSKLSINGGLHVGGDSDAGDNNLIVDGTITQAGLVKEFVGNITDLDTTIRVDIEFTSQASNYTNHIVELYVTAQRLDGDYTPRVGIFRYALVTFNVIQTMEDMTHDIKNGLTEATSSSGMHFYSTITSSLNIGPATVYARIVTASTLGTPISMTLT